MKYLERSLATAMLFCLVLILTLVLSACNDKTAKALRDTAIGLKTTAKSLATLHNEGLINDQAYPELVNAQIEVVSDHKAAVALFRALDTITPENKGQALLKVDALLSSLERLQARGALHIKDPTKQKVFVAGVASTRASVGIIRAFIEQVTEPTPLKIPNDA